MQPIKKIIFGEKSRGTLAEGAIAVADIVATTAGAAGRNVCISQPTFGPKITKDGVTVAKSINLEGVKGDGAKLMIQASEKTAKEAGDGTSNTTILAREIIRQGLKQIKKGVKPIYVKRGIDKAVDEVVKEIKNMSRPVSSHADIRNIALISANGDTSVADIVSEAVIKVGENGTIMVENSTTDKNSVEITDGLSFDSGFLSPYFQTDYDKAACVLNNPYILMYDSRITNIKSILPLLEQINQQSRSLLIICDDMDNDVLASLVQNHLRKILQCCAVKLPMMGDFRTGFMEDIAALTGGTYFSSQLGVDLENITLDQLGVAEKVTITDSNTIIRQDTKKLPESIKLAIQERIALLKGLIETSTSEYVKSTAEERLAKLDGGVAIVRVGGKTEAEVNEIKDRVDDAICATQSAREEGIVVGGGVALYNIGKKLSDNLLKASDKDVNIGINILIKSLEAPMKQIIDNTGNKYSKIKKRIDKLDNPQIGYDVVSGKITDLCEIGIIDSAKVIRCALQNAASIAGTILTVNGLITNDVDEMIRYNNLLAK